MTTLFTHHLVNDPFGDPTLHVVFREERRALLFDLGDLSPLRPGQLLRVSHVFVTHTHMDHFAGFDHLLAVILGRQSRLVLFEPTFRVRACFVDHGMPCLAYALEEKAHVHVAADRLAAMGVTTGAWLRALKHAVLSGQPGDTPIALHWHDRDGEHAMTRRVDELSALVLDSVAGERIGYVTDLRGTPANADALARLLMDVDVLYIESVFLAADHDHAERKNHLTARRAGEIAHRLRAKQLVPFHHSPRYEGRAQELVDEANAAWLSEQDLCAGEGRSGDRAEQGA